MTPAIVCDCVSKSYTQARPLGIKEMLVGRHRRTGRFVRTWAMRDVTFEVPESGSFGIVGSNGSGKTTLLSVLLGVLHPEQGRVEVRGRVASLLELGAGFHPELTGRQNLFLYGAILGMRLHEIRARIDGIVEFSGLGDAVELPLRTYSSGMIMRLGFATIAHAGADLLLVDEVLAVGDVEFQERCHGFLRGFRQQGGTLVMVSHDLTAVASMCDHGLCLDQGQVHAMGAMPSVVRAYRDLAQTRLDVGRDVT